MSKLTTLVNRGKNLESLHEIKCFIGSLNGKKIFSTNNEKLNPSTEFPNSRYKPRIGTIKSIKINKKIILDILIKLK